MGLDDHFGDRQRVEIGRGYLTDGPTDHGGRKGKNSTSEVYIRNMFDAWLGFMTHEPDAARRPAVAAE